MDIRNAINKRIAEIRDGAITSQAALARHLDVDPSQLNRQLAGREAMSDERLAAIEAALGLELSRPDAVLAHHEAGHAVIAVACGAITSTARQDADDWMCESHWAAAPDPITRCAVALGGIAAEARFEGGAVDAYDVVQELDSWRIVGVEPGSDAETIDALDLSYDDEIKAAEIAAAAVVTHWELIRRVADELVGGLPSVIVTKKSIEEVAR